MQEVKFARYSSLSHLDEKYERKHPWFFTAAMIGRFAPVFDACEDNHEVADVLREAGVITEEDLEDAEACQFFCNFQTKKQGREFIDRLNTYIAEKTGQEYVPPKLTMNELEVDEIADLIDSGENRDFQVDRGEEFAQRLTDELLERGWRFSDSYSACSKATYEVNLAKIGTKEQINIVTTCFLGVFTQVERSSYFPTNLEILQEKSHASSNA